MLTDLSCLPFFILDSLESSVHNRPAYRYRLAYGSSLKVLVYCPAYRPAYGDVINSNDLH